MRQNIGWIDTAKGVCILLVVAHHINITSYGYGISPDILSQSVFAKIYNLFSVYLSPLRMPLFFLLSGFLVRRYVLECTWSDVLKKRILSLFYLFALWGAIQWCAVYFINEMGQPDSRLSTATNALYATSFGEFLALMSRGGSSLWYLYALPIYFTLCKLFGKKPLVAMALLFCAHVFSQLHLEQWPTKGIVGNAVYYGLGCFWGRQIFSAFSAVNLKMLAWLAFCFLFALFVRFVGLSQSLPLSILAIVFSVIAFSTLQEKFSLSWLSWLGKNTLQIYVIHRILVEFLGVILLPFLSSIGFFGHELTDTLWLSLYPVVATVVVTTVSLLIWRVTSKGLGRSLYSLPNFNFMAGLKSYRAT